MINIDISNIWGEASLPDLLALEVEVSEAHRSLTEGGKGRSWMQLPAAEPTETIARILAAAENIRSESDVLVVIGTGGSCLGARGVIELLQGTDRGLVRGEGYPRILFTGSSLSTRRWHELQRLLEGRDFSLCVIGSGDDIAPAIACRSFRWMLERRYGTEEARRRIYAVTDASESGVGQMASEEGWEHFAIPDDVDSRFSVLSPAGLLPMAAAGIDITELLRGAYEAKETYDLRSYENPAWLYAAVRKLMLRRGKQTELLAVWEPGFSAMGAWWQQLFAGTTEKNGMGLFPIPVEFPAGLSGPGKLLREGQRSLFETMLRFDSPEQKTVILGDVKDADGLNYLEGMTLDFVEEQAYLSAVAAQADTGVSFICMDCGGLKERDLGELIWFFQLSSSLSAGILGADLADQPGAEPYKESLFRLLGRPEAAAEN